MVPRWRLNPSDRAVSSFILKVAASFWQPFGGFDIVDLKFGEKTLRARTASGFVDRVGTQVFARLDPSQAHFFDSKSGASLGIRLGAQ